MGGNNDFPFYKPDLHIVVCDPFRVGHESLYYPGELNLRMADVAIINKVNTAKSSDVKQLEKNIKEIVPSASQIKVKSVLIVDNPALIKGKKVLVIEDGPTSTHGGMKFGAGYFAAKKYKAKSFASPAKYAVGSLKDTYECYPHMKNILPAMGYGKKQISELQKTINQTPCDMVVFATPIDLSKIVKIKKPFVRVRYELEEMPEKSLAKVIKKFIQKI